MARRPRDEAFYDRRARLTSAAAIGSVVLTPFASWLALAPLRPPERQETVPSNLGSAYRQLLGVRQSERIPVAIDSQPRMQPDERAASRQTAELLAGASILSDVSVVVVNRTAEHVDFALCSSSNFTHAQQRLDPRVGVQAGIDIPRRPSFSSGEVGAALAEGAQRSPTLGDFTLLFQSLQTPTNLEQGTACSGVRRMPTEMTSGTMGAEVTISVEGQQNLVGFAKEDGSLRSTIELDIGRCVSAQSAAERAAECRLIQTPEL